RDDPERRRARSSGRSTAQRKRFHPRPVRAADESRAVVHRSGEESAEARRGVEMNANTTKALFRDALFQVLDNKVFRILVDVVVLMVLPTFLIGAHDDSLVVL